ncbi:MAG TPA: hypothetical protein VLI45_07945 [Acidobacteriaceae bacterium]|nr:hypothetical protein [Acidobacteriaceae bacterium]
MNTLRLLLFSAASSLLITGCHVSSHNHQNGNKVDIGTPFGSLHVKTNDKAQVAGLGITPYPGAVPYKGDNDDTDSADVNLSFGSFHLGVRAASYKTPDGEDPVLAFYKKDLGRYGEVLECEHDKPVGEPTHTSQGLTCSEDNHSYHHSTVHTGSHLELRAGSPQHQHIVAVEEKDGGTKIGLVALDLPEHHDSSDKE